MCTDDGVCFEIVNIVPYLRKHKRHPVTGAPLALSELTRLHFHRNADGEYHCPVLNKARARARASRGHTTAPVRIRDAHARVRCRFSPSRRTSWP